MSLMHVRRFWAAGLVLAAAIALLAFSFHAERHLETATRVEGSEAESVRLELASRFHSPFVDRVVLVIQGLPPADSEEGAQALATIVAALKDEPGVSGVVSYLELRDPIFLGRGGGTFILVGLSSADTPNGSVESLVPELHQQAHALENQLRGRYPAVKLELTGEIPLNFDIRKASADDVQRGESLVIPATLALLLVAFGSLVAALIPLAVGQLAIATPLAIPAVLALLGPRINAGRMPFTPKLDEQRAARTGNRWRQWGKVIVAHPWLALVLAGAPLLLLAWQATRLDTSLPTRDR